MATALGTEDRDEQNGHDGRRHVSGGDSPPPPQRGLSKTFSALRIPAYRLLWGSMLFGFLGMQMQMVARGVLAYEIGGTNSAIAIVGLGWGVPMLVFGLIGGTFADRFDRRKVMILSQAGTAAVAVSIALLVEFGYIQLEHLFISGLVQGSIFAFSGPARQAFIPEVVGERQLMNAIALNSAGMNLTRIVGPSIAGALIAISFVNIEGVFYLQAGMNTAALLLLLALPWFKVDPDIGKELAPEEAGAQPSRWGGARGGWSGGRRSHSGSVTKDLIDGLRYVIASPILLTLLLMGLLPSLIGMSYQTFLPVFAKDVFGDGVSRNSAALGVMMTLTGVGALAGSLVVASMQDYPRRTQMQLFAGLGFGLSLAAFAISGSYIVALLFLVVIGFMASFFQALNSTMVMTASDPQYYGRVMSVNMMTFALMPVGTLPIGFLADAVGHNTLLGIEFFGIQTALLAAGIVITVFILVATVSNPAYRKLEQNDFKHFAQMAVDRVEADREGGSMWQQLRRAGSQERGSRMAMRIREHEGDSEGPPAARQHTHSGSSS